MTKNISTNINKKYFSVIQLLDACGPWNERLDQVSQIIKDPDFTYNESPLASFLSVTLANSSYWLEQELFNTSVIKKSLTDKFVSGEQRDHLHLLDIGSVLIDKGFPLNQETVDRFVSKDSPLYSWAKNYLIQSHKRNAWLKKAQSVSYKKQSVLPNRQKTRA